MANEQNLIPFTSDQNREEAAKNGRKGGVASGAARRAKRTMREELEMLLATMVKDKHGNDTDKTVQAAITAALVKSALGGDTKAYGMIRDTVGEKPIDRIAVAEVDQETIDKVEAMVRGT